MLRPVPRPRTKTDEKTLRGRPVWIDETGYVTGEKGTRYSEQTVTIPFGTEYIVSPSIDEDGSLLSEEEVKQKLKDSEGRDFITGEKLPTFETEEEADKYAEWRSSTMENLEEIEKGYKPVLEQQQYEEDVEETLSDKVMRKAKPFTDEVKGFVEYLLTPSQHFNEGGLATQTETAFGFTAEGAKQEAEKYAEEFNEQDQANINKAAEFLVPFYDSGVNISNVVQEYMKPEAERDNEYIKDQFKQAGQSAAIEGGMLLMGGILAKYGAKGVKALADKVKQYEIDPNVAYSFPAIAIRKKVVDKSADIKEAEKLIDDPKKMKDWQESNKLPETKRQANPEDSKKAAQELFEGKITSKEARKRIQEAIPDPELYSAEQVLGMMPSVTEITGSLGKKAGKFGILGVKGFDLKKGQKVSSRLDIPAYNNYDTWVVSIHDGTVEKGSVVGFGQAIRLKNIRFGSKSKDALDIARGKRRTPAGEDKPMGKSTIARIFGEYVPEDPYKLQQQAADIIASGSDEWTQIGMNPYRGSGFYIKETGAPVFDADEVIQVGPLVLAKNIKKPTISQIKEMGVKTTDGKLRLFNEGGTVMKDDMNMGYALGGEVDAIDPVSGNEIPPGSTAKEVRDDIPTMLSEGEYVVPADVLKFYGLKFFEDLRDNAKVEMAELEEEGRIGGQPIPEEGDLTEDEMRLLGEVMGMAEGGMTPMQPQQPQPPQPMMMGQQMMPPKPQPTSYNKPVGFDEGGMTDAFGNPIGPKVDPVKPPEKLLQDIDPTSTNIYGIDKEATGTSSPTNLAQEDIGVNQDTTNQTPSGDGSGMKSVFYFHKDGRRIQVLMLNGRPISSVPADFNEFKEDTPENRTEVIQETPSITDDISGGVGETDSGSTRKTDEEERKVQSQKLETLKTNKEKKRVEEFNNLLDPKSDTWKADTDGSKLLEEYRKAKVGQGLSFALPGFVGLAGAGITKKNLKRIEEAYLKKAEELNISPEEAQKNLDSITITDAITEGVTKPFKDKDMGQAMSDMFGSGFYDKYEAKYSVSDYLEDESIVGFQKDPVTNALSGNLDVKQQQHFDNAVDSGTWQIAEHFSRVAKSNAAKDQFAVDNADAISEIQKLEKGTAEYDTAFKKLKSNNKVGNLYLGDSSIEEVIELGSSALTAKNLGKAEKEDKFFGKTVAKTDDNGNKNNSPITSTSSGSSPSSSSSSTKKDTIKSGDTLSAIAAKNNTTVNELMKANPNIKDANKIYAGDSINIPQKSSGGGGGSSGGGGGGSSSPSASSAASGCVIATHAVASGAFQSGDKANAVEWCKKTLHDKWWGETMRKGYRYLGRKHIANGTAETVYKEFKECIEWANGKRPFTIKVASRYYYRAIQTFLVGLFVKEEV